MKIANAITIAIVLSIAAAKAKPAKPVEVTDPAAAMKALYAKFEKDDYSTKLPLSARLNALMALDTREAKGEVGRLDGDYYTNSQDAKVSDVTVTARNVENAPGRKVVVVLAGHRHRRISRNGAFWSKPGRGTWPIDTARRRSQPGRGKSGTSPTATTGWARSRSTARCMMSVPAP